MGMAEDFNDFWARFPRKIGKLAAQKAYEKTRQRGVTQQQLLEAIAAYVQYKPAYADFCHPVTWLTQGRYLDEHETTTREDVRSWCQHVNACPNLKYHEHMLVMEARNKA